METKTKSWILLPLVGLGAYFTLKKSSGAGSIAFNYSGLVATVVPDIGASAFFTADLTCTIVNPAAVSQTKTVRVQYKYLPNDPTIAPTEWFTSGFSKSLTLASVEAVSFQFHGNY